jgi:monoamine oxidase
MDMIETDVAIIGGGLAGLALAYRLHHAGRSFALFEARDRFGGRIAAITTDRGRVDLGPSWFWPGQPRIARLIDDLGLRAFAQYAEGDICFQDAQGAVHRGIGYASMEGALRIAGGCLGLIDGLVARLPAQALHLDARVLAIGQTGVGLADGRRFGARHIVLALPPRVVAGLRFDPALPDAAQAALAAIPTWMAGHAKFVAIYDRPFWRAAGLSGDVTSRRGPLAEIHDASGDDGTPAALFGFLGLSADQRAGRARQIEAAALDQLAQVFGPEALSPVATRLQDWATEPMTATIADRAPLSGHPAYGVPPALVGLWDGRLHVAATETAPEMGGLMEGALASADRVARLILGQGQ